MMSVNFPAFYCIRTGYLTLTETADRDFSERSRQIHHRYDLAPPGPQHSHACPVCPLALSVSLDLQLSTCSPPALSLKSSSTCSPPAPAIYKWGHSGVTIANTVTVTHNY
uniref:Uncharacterized protein n=1 Tax=Fundulus heteroclitus TaxID=8078 RepID=A0A3Q2NU03_FUNHE